MPIDFDKLKRWDIPTRIDDYTQRDCMLYAQSLGYGHDPLDAHELQFVYETGLRVVPSFLTVIGAPGAWATHPGTGIDWLRILHGEHRMTLHAPPRPQGRLESTTRVARIVDKGVGRGALVVTEREIRCVERDMRLATIEHTSFCRSDGGIGRSDEAPAALPARPEREADAHCLLTTHPSAALLYRLNGDWNPIHADPEVARNAGFTRPILHGLCTYGMACRAVVQLCCDGDSEKLASFGLRFSAPFYPGETLRVDVWKTMHGTHFEASCVERGVKVLSHGFATFNTSKDPQK